MLTEADRHQSQDPQRCLFAPSKSQSQTLREEIATLAGENQELIEACEAYAEVRAAAACLAP